MYRKIKDGIKKPAACTCSVFFKTTTARLKETATSNTMVTISEKYALDVSRYAHMVFRFRIRAPAIT